MQYPIPKEALDDRLAFVGTAGSGKTYNAGSGVEMLLARKARVVIIDPLGVWWGLRLRPDGKSESPYDVVIFGGPHGDIAINEHAGALIGETVAAMAESCIIDLSQIGTKAGERRFMLAFLTALYRKTTGEPLHLIVDEADMFAPQRLLDKDGEAAKLLGMMETVVRRGRVRGFIPWLITQRPAVLSKDVLSQADGMIAFKLTASQDRAAIGAWIEGQADQQEGKAILASLPGMQRGQGVVWIPSRGILETASFPEKHTFDSSRTPKRGETMRKTELKPLDIGKLKERLSTIEAEAKANDPNALKAEIAKLKKELSGLGRDQSEIQAAYARGMTTGYDRAVQAVTAESIAMIKALERAHSALQDAQSTASQMSHWAKQVKSEPAVAAAKLLPSRVTSPIKTTSDLPADGLTMPQHRVMASLAFWKSIGHEAPTREQVAAIAGYRPGSGNFNNIIGGLSSAGQTMVPAPGRLALNVEYRSITPSEAKAKLWSVLENPQRRLVEAAMQVDGDLSRDELATNSGYSPGSGNFNNIAGSLSSMDILQRTGTGRVALSSWAREVL